MMLTCDERIRRPVSLPGAIVSGPRVKREPPKTGGHSGARRDKYDTVPDAEPGDIFGAYSRVELLKMDARFAQRLERAFARGLEKKESACADFQPHR
jgi:hypothetical protein